jgi:predicted O-methyltransferase YrrM
MRLSIMSQLSMSGGRGTFLAEVQKARPHRVLEIGMAIGYSTLLLAQHSAEDVRITTLELSEERAETARRYIARSPYADRITIHVGDAGELLTQLAETDSEAIRFCVYRCGQGTVCGLLS